MPEVDPNELPEHGLFDSESEPRGISSVDPAIELGVNMSFPPLPTLCKKLETPTRAAQWVTYHCGGQNLIKGRISRYPKPISPSKQVTFTDPVSPWAGHG